MSDMEDDGRLGSADRATPEPSPQAVSSLRGGIADAGEWRAESFDLSADEWADVRSEAGAIVCFDKGPVVTEVVACVFGEAAGVCEARAAFIVRACNSHYELLEALAGVLDGLPFDGTENEYELVQSGCTPTEAAQLAKAFAAITKARGQ